MRLKSAFIAGLLLCGAACFGEQKWYALPRQVVMPSGPEPADAIASGERLAVAMSDADANVHVLGDVFDAPDGAEWRWTGLHPRFLLRVDNASGLTFFLRFFNHDEALRTRGPVSFTVRINGKALPARRFDTSDDQIARWPLQEGWIEKPGAMEISVEIDPPWRRIDGRSYGVLLHSVGFERAARSAAVAEQSAPAVPVLRALREVGAILFAAAFTFLVSLALGKALLKRLGIEVHGFEELFFAFVAGSACLSMVVFVISVARLAYPWVFFVAGCAGIAASWAYGAMRFSRGPEIRIDGVWRKLGVLLYAVFAALYFVAALCPESSADGNAYHVALPALYLRVHHIPAITTNLLAALSEGVEMLYLFAFSFGRHSAASMVHLLFALLTPLAMFSYGKRVGRPLAGAVGGLLFFLSPATAVAGTAAYVDIAAAAVAFSVFYLIEIWREEQRDAMLVLIGMLAGFAFAIKYTGAVAAAYALGAILLRRWRLRKPMWRPLAIVAVPAFAMMIPWLAKNSIVLGNPVAPFANRWFPNPYITPSMERAYVASISSLHGIRIWEWPYDITARGAHTQGFVGPVFLLAPLALLALTNPVGRRLLCAAVVFALPYTTAPPARYILPALTFIALALGLVFSRWKYVAAGVVMLHAVLSWPQVIPKYALLFGAPGPYLEMPDWRAALRLTPESTYLEQHVYGEERLDGYGIGRVLDTDVKDGERALAFRTFQQAYHSREVLVAWESASGERLQESLRAAINPHFEPTVEHRFSFAPAAVRKIRVLQVGRGGSADPWSVSEMRVFKDQIELRRSFEWRVRASPNDWDVRLAFDNSPLTRWSSRQAPAPGMYVEADFGRPQTINLVTLDAAPAQWEIKMDVQFESGPGIWQSLGARHEVVQVELPPQMRRAAAEELVRHNVEWLVVNDADEGARDFLMRQAQWGIRMSGRSERYCLYRVEPREAPGSDAIPAESRIAASMPLELEGFWDLENGKFRWTKQRFAVTFVRPDAPGRTPKLVLKLYVADSTIQKLGSVTLTARLGDHVLQPATYAQTGEYTFERELQPEWLHAGANRFEFALDKAVAPTAADKRELGIIVERARLEN